MADDRVMNALLAKIYQLLTAPDQVTGSNSLNDNAFITFCVPGVPLNESALDFLNMTTKQQIDAGARFSRFVNAAPKPTGFWTTSASPLWSIYLDAINNAIVNPRSISPDDQKRLDAATSVLWSYKSKIDPITGAIIRVKVPSQNYSDYKGFEKDYNDALIALNGKVIWVNNNPNDNAAAQDLAMNGPIYRQAVTDAWNQWGTVKNTVEVAQQTISQITSDGPALFFQRIKNDLATMRLMDSLRSEYYPTAYFPNEFWKSNSWTNFKFGHDEEHKYWNESSTNWGGGTSGGWGLWSWSVGVQHSDHKTYDSCNTNNFQVSVDLVQIPLVRPWLEPLLFSNHSWRLQPGAAPISDGAPLPATQGTMPILPTSMIVARNLQVTLDMTDTVNTTYNSTTRGSGSVGWGPFSLRGGYESVSSGGTHDYSSTNAGLSCPGMQVLGFVCSVLPKSPNADPALLGADLFELGQISGPTYAMHARNFL